MHGNHHIVPPSILSGEPKLQSEPGGFRRQTVIIEDYLTTSRGFEKKGPRHLRLSHLSHRRGVLTTGNNSETRHRKEYSYVLRERQTGDLRALKLFDRPYPTG
ncbi:hypothetical protein EVAR_28015_1 [Eumeta japonica]|uniref:Uncharacterized protein n=1 Tax=Eumeta variegata TaxID=151549 RepID=A0A4C1WDW3_EUMVA|nr:hypothetical protein EVAR_28015_1 [Eumeta japonica]